MKDKLKIVSTPWHCMHFWDLFNALKDDADFYLIHNSSKKWYYETRPLPDNASFIPYYQKGKYDMAILDIDQQCVNPDLGKSKVFKELNEQIQDIPKVIINHGSPVYPEFLKIGDDETLEYAEQKCKRDMKKLVGDTTMVVNSYKAATSDEWGWGYPIWHGMNPDDWFDLDKEPRVFTSLSAAGCDEYYNRQCMIEVSQILEEYHSTKLNWARVNVPTEDSFDLYRKWLGQSLIYLDTSFRTVMNRSRTEAMLSGCCVVQVEGAHDLERFVKDGENMIIVPNDAKQIVEKIMDLLQNGYSECLKIGQAGKQTALEKFNYKRYREDWLKLINKIL